MFRFADIHLHFMHIFRTDWIFWTKFGSSDPSFNRGILTLLVLKFETSASAEIAVNHIGVNTYYLQVSWNDMNFGKYIRDTFKVSRDTT